jgi:hypothetical protein
MSHNIENDESGLLLSVDPIPEHSLNFTAINDDTDNVPADTDTEDEVGDTDGTDDTDTDTVDDADGTD